MEQYKRQNTKRDAQSALFGAPSVRIHGFNMASNIRWLIKVLLIISYGMLNTQCVLLICNLGWCLAGCI